MPGPLHIQEIHIRATLDEVWAAITDPAWTRRYLSGAAIEAILEPGSGIRYLAPGGDPLGEGLIEAVEPGRRLVMTWRSLRDASQAEEPPGRIEWTLAPANAEGTVTRVRVRHFDLGLSPATWADSGPRWGPALSGLKTVLETGDDLGPIDLDPGDGASTSTTDIAEEVTRRWHRSLAVDANNSTWELLDGRELSGDEAFDLLGRAYAAAHHWRATTEPDSINRARAAWLCSRAHAVLGDGGAALRLAEHCAELTAGAGDAAADFDRVYAVEARARALACLGRLDEAGRLRREATEAAAGVADEEDRKIVEGDLAAEPWFLL